jgi:hypothetical protein
MSLLNHLPDRPIARNGAHSRLGRILSLFVLLAVAASSRAAEVSFMNDVMAVLSKGGCNQGTCHGNKYGKGGFKLTLRGQDPDVDYATLTREMFGRRVDALDPDQSLVLLKATTQVAHEGGMPEDFGRAPKLVKLEVTPLEQVLVEPVEQVQIRVQATFSDGTSRDLTNLACYDTANTLVAVSHGGLVRREGFGETTVLVRYLNHQVPVRLAFIPARPGFAAKIIPANNFIDDHVFAKLRSLRITPAELCNDTEFLRRAFFDLVGFPPTAEEARAFLADRRKDKRAKAVDQLLERPEFADSWAVKWSDLLRNEEKALDKKGVQNFHHWIRQSLAENKPMDQFVREIVASRGSTYAVPPANFYRSLRDPVSRAESSAQVFLGIRLQCAQCHNHPFDRWTQDDYYDWTTVFARVDYKVMENNRRDRLDKHEFIGEQIVYMARDGEVKNARTGKDATPRFLGAGVNPDRDADRLEALAGWLTSPANDRFARMQVNRIWYQLMGRGIVDPIDDFRPTNPPSHPALLEALAKDFVNRKYDLRHVIRLVMNSRAYQLSSEPNDSNRDDEVNYSHVLPRRLAAEQLVDAQHQFLGVPPQFAGYPAGMRAGQLPGGANMTRRRDGQTTSSMDKFLQLFGKPQRLLTCECERSSETTMNQAFQLISGPALNELLTQPGNRLSKFVETGKPPSESIHELYWAALSRPPTQPELQATTAHLEKSPDKRKALEDIAWGLLNAKEFVLRK